jgi:hypothetical protein
VIHPHAGCRVLGQAFSHPAPNPLASRSMFCPNCQRFAPWQADLLPLFPANGQLVPPVPVVFPPKKQLVPCVNAYLGMMMRVEEALPSWLQAMMPLEGPSSWWLPVVVVLVAYSVKCYRSSQSCAYEQPYTVASFGYADLDLCRWKKHRSRTHTMASLYW